MAQLINRMVVALLIGVFLVSNVMADTNNVFNSLLAQPEPMPQVGATQLSPAAAKIKEKVEKVSVNSRITVVLKDKNENYGRVTKIDTDSFEVDEVDQKVKITIPYEKVKKIRKGYGGKNFISGKRPNPIYGYLVIGGLVGLLAGLLSQME